MMACPALTSRPPRFPSADTMRPGSAPNQRITLPIQFPMSRCAAEKKLIIVPIA